MHGRRTDRYPKGLARLQCLYRAASVARIYGEATPSQLNGDAVQTLTIIEIRDKVGIVSGDEVKEHKAYVVVEFSGGTKFEVHDEHILGSYESPSGHTIEKQISGSSCHGHF